MKDLILSICTVQLRRLPSQIFCLFTRRNARRVPLPAFCKSNDRIPVPWHRTSHDPV